MDLPRVLTVYGAFRLGLTRAQVRTELRRGRWRRLAAGVVLTRPEPPTRADWMHVGAALGGRTAAISGWDVVRRHGLGPVTPPDDHVLCSPAAATTDASAVCVFARAIASW